MIHGDTNRSSKEYADGTSYNVSRLGITRRSCGGQFHPKQMAITFEALVVTCVFTLIGCASPPEKNCAQPIFTESKASGAVVEPAQTRPRLSESQYHEIVTAANEMAIRGGNPPEAIRTLKPVEVYSDHGNVMIALDRSIRDEQGRRVCFEERGFCVQPSVSCSAITASDAHWRFKPVGSSGLYEYVWRK
jgi:hypothetical protein